MEQLLEISFILAGHLVQLIGGVLAILLIGLLPLYLLAYGLYRTQTGVMSSASTLALSVLAVVLALCLSGVIFVSAMVLRAWGPMNVT
jgi:hypothetical protein